MLYNSLMSIGADVRNLSRTRLLSRLVAGAMLFASVVSPGLAEEASDPAIEQARRQAEYEKVLGEITISGDRLASLQAEVEALKQDDASITAALIQAAKTEKKLSADIDAIGEKLDGLRLDADGVRMSLIEKRDVFATVLGALERMGLNPPPAILVSPEDALSSVRSAILLGAVVPEMRAETRALASEMAELQRIVASIEAERGRLAATVETQVEEKEKLQLLQAEKQRLRGRSEAELESERKRSGALASKARDMRQLIAALEREQERRRLADEAAAKAETDRIESERQAARRAIPEANRLASGLPFPQLRGQVALPAVGRLSGRFGAPDEAGGTRQGDTVTTQSGAIVTAPSDATVLYAGPFRSYGQLLILNAGDGYHIVLAGMGRINVGPGQAVLAGEPVGAMGETRLASTVAVGDGAGPELYVEFRKEGKPVDPSPWWTGRLSGRTADGT